MNVRTDGRRYLELIPYSDVLKLIEESFVFYTKAENVKLQKCLGRTCAHDIRSSVNMPAKNISAMDGYGVRASATEHASITQPVRLSVISGADIGAVRTRGSVLARAAVRLSTGSEVPEGVDAVVRIEETRLNGGKVEIVRPVPRWKNIERVAEDFRAGQMLVRSGEVMTPARISLLMSAGHETVAVRKQPAVGILSVGSDLRSFEERNPKKLNNYAYLIAEYLTQVDARPVLLGRCEDDPEVLSRIIKSKLSGLQMLITIGRSSVGTEDLAAETVFNLPGFVRLFHGIRLLPIKPTGLGSHMGKPICILPARAVSVALSFFMVALPVLNVIQGFRQADRPIRVVTDTVETFENHHSVESLILVRLGREGKRTTAHPLEWGSNLSYQLALASGYTIVPPKGRVICGMPIEVSLFPGIRCQ